MKLLSNAFYEIIYHYIGSQIKLHLVNYFRIFGGKIQ